MSDDLETIQNRHSLTAERIAAICGVSERTARAWIAGEKGLPETARRLLLVVLGDVRPEEFDQS